MTPLRQRMLEDMQLSGLALKTQQAYIRAVRQLAQYYGKSPDQISEDELLQYIHDPATGQYHTVPCALRLNDSRPSHPPRIAGSAR